MSLPSPSISFPPLPPSTSPRDLPPPPPAIPYSHVLLPRFFHSQQSSLAGFRHAPPLQQAAMPDRQPPNLRELNARHEARRSMNTKQGHERSASGTPAHRGSQQPRSASNEGRKKERDNRKKNTIGAPLGSQRPTPSPLLPSTPPLPPAHHPCHRHNRGATATVVTHKNDCHPTPAPPWPPRRLPPGAAERDRPAGSRPSSNRSPTAPPSPPTGRGASDSTTRDTHSPRPPPVARSYPHPALLPPQLPPPARRVRKQREKGPAPHRPAAQ